MSVPAVLCALCVKCVCDVSSGSVSVHVLVGVWVNSSVCVAGVIVEDTAVLGGGGSRQKERGVRRVSSGNGSEGMVCSDKEDPKPDS